MSSHSSDWVGESDLNTDWDFWEGPAVDGARVAGERQHAKTLKTTPWRWDPVLERMVNLRREKMSTPNQLATSDAVASQEQAIERVILQGDLSQLSPADRVKYYRMVCESLGLNPLTQPFAYVNLSGKVVLYARREAAEQLRALRGLSLRITAREIHDGVYVVTSQARTKDGREDEATGAVWINGLSGEPMANAMMKAETKAKRRVTLSICGLSMPDESEVDATPGAVRVKHDDQTGEILEPTPAPTQLSAPAAPPTRDDGPGMATVEADRVRQEQLFTKLKAALERAVTPGEYDTAMRACRAVKSKQSLTIGLCAKLAEIAAKQKLLIAELQKQQQRVAEEAIARISADIPLEKDEVSF